MDTNDEAFQLLNPVISKLDESKKNKIASQFEEVVDDDGEGPGVDPDKEDERLNTGKAHHLGDIF